MDWSRPRPLTREAATFENVGEVQAWLDAELADEPLSITAYRLDGIADDLWRRDLAPETHLYDLASGMDAQDSRVLESSRTVSLTDSRFPPPALWYEVEDSANSTDMCPALLSQSAPDGAVELVGMQCVRLEGLRHHVVVKSRGELTPEDWIALEIAQSGTAIFFPVADSSLTIHRDLEGYVCVDASADQVSRDYVLAQTEFGAKWSDWVGEVEAAYRDALRASPELNLTREYTESDGTADIAKIGTSYCWRCRSEATHFIRYLESPNGSEATYLYCLPHHTIILAEFYAVHAWRDSPVVRQVRKSLVSGPLESQDSPKPIRGHVAGRFLANRKTLSDPGH